MQSIGPLCEQADDGDDSLTCRAVVSRQRDIRSGSAAPGARVARVAGVRHCAATAFTGGGDTPAQCLQHS